jgi:hypothetical protein
LDIFIGHHNLIPLDEANTYRYNDLRLAYFYMEDPNSSSLSLTLKKRKENAVMRYFLMVYLL